MYREQRQAWCSLLTPAKANGMAVGARLLLADNGHSSLRRLPGVRKRSFSDTILVPIPNSS